MIPGRHYGAGQRPLKVQTQDVNEQHAACGPHDDKQPILQRHPSHGVSDSGQQYSSCPLLCLQEHGEPEEDDVRLRSVSLFRPTGIVGRRGVDGEDLISPQHNLGFSQQSYKGRETEG